MAIRIHFIPPVVDPAQAPNNMMITLMSKVQVPRSYNLQK